jgi:localization factor PodJL
MKSGGPWNLRGLRPETRAAARDAARRSGMSVGEWLNTVIQPTDEDEWSADFEREPEDRSPRGVRHEDHDRYGGESWRRQDREPDAQRRHSYRHDDWDRDQRGDADRRNRERGESDAASFRRGAGPPREQAPQPGGPYYETQRRGSGRNGDQEEPYRESARRHPGAHDRRDERAAARPPFPRDDRDAFIDQAVAEIAARQRALDAGGASETAETQDATLGNGAGETAARRSAADGDVAAEVAASESAPPGEAAELSFGQRPAMPLGPSEGSVHASTPALNLSGLEQQLRQITARIEALRPGKELEAAINGLRADLVEIGRSLTEALPRRAVESLEIEVKALGERIDHSRHSGADKTALTGLERGLADVREALQNLTPAESLVGFEEAVSGLAKKVDAIAAKDDPAALQQLEAAIAALRGIVAHVASNDTLTKVAEEVRALAGKVDAISNSAVSRPILSGIEERIDTLAAALRASTEAGHAVPRELEKLLSGLIEKLEWVQLTHTDHTALAHLEDRIAALVKRLDASDSRLGRLEGVERGLADLLVHIDQLRGAKDESAGPAKRPLGVEVIEQEVARTQDSLEAVQGTVEHVVDRLAMLESGIRADKGSPSLPEPPPLPAQKPTPVPSPEPVPMSVAAASASASDVAAEPPGAAPHLAALAREPIDPSLPPDHPLEPGSAGRARNPPSAAARIAASEAVVGPKPPVIPDPGGGKPDFIAAARRAARAAALESAQHKSGAQVAIAGTTRPKKLSDRVRTFMVAAAVVAIVLGGYRIISRLFEDGGPSVPSHTQTEPPRQHVGPSPPHELPSPRTEPVPVPSPPPQVRMESPPPAAETAPGNSTNPTPSLPLPDAEAPPSGSAPAPDVSPGAGTGPAERQSMLGRAGWLSAVIGGAAPDASASKQGPSAPLDITGSLPSASASTRSTIDDRLPPAIGGAALRAAALAGDAAAAYEVAVRFAEGRGVRPNNEQAARWFERAAKKGLAPAQFRLGSIYEKGLGVKKNLAAARDYYRAAADKGHGKAMHNLAVLYAEGIDGPPDYRMAAQWFRKAADRGVSDSQYNLAVLYARGVGVEQSFAESYKWFFLAAKEGDKDAAQKRDEVAARLDEQALSVARIDVERWTPVPQPADAVTVKSLWDPPASEAAVAKPTAAAAAKGSAPGAAKVY